MWAGRAWYAVRTLLLMLGVFVSGVLGVAAGMERQELRDWPGVLGGLGEVLVFVGILTALGAPLLLLLRRRHLEDVAWGLGLLALVLPLGPVMAFVLPQAIRERDRQEAESLSFLYVVGLIGWFVRDSLGRTGASSAVRGITSGSSDLSSTAPVGFNGVGVAVLFLVLAVTPIAIGFYRRARSELADTRAEADTQRAVAGEMSAQLSRQAERDLIAREVHDVIGHRLSLLSLHAGGLEVAAGDDPELRENARYVRENAQQAMDDLRSLIGVLREPHRAGAAGPGSLDPSVTSLADLARVVDEMADSGGPVASSVFLTDPEQADPVLAHSVYRIVQELLTNARKHAPDQVVRLRVSGGPQQGVLVEATNPVAHDAVLRDGTDLLADGTGLRGVRERAELLGGQVETPDEDGRFTVRVHLPWQGRTVA